jgi:hypothetical protein
MRVPRKPFAMWIIVSLKISGSGPKEGTGTKRFDGFENDTFDPLATGNGHSLQPKSQTVRQAS